jgi:hypothetical protein
VTQLCAVVGALSLVWIAARPHLTPGRAEAARETVAVDLERIGGRLIVGGAIPILASTPGPDPPGRGDRVTSFAHRTPVTRRVHHPCSLDCKIASDR